MACFAFVANMTFKQAVIYLGKEYSVRHGWRPSDLAAALSGLGLSYKNNYVRKKEDIIYPNGTIVLIERSPVYPVGHYLVFQDNQWMDPWINLPEDNTLKNAESDFRYMLPGKAMYSLIPT